MTAALTSRRHWITTGLLSVTALWLPATATAAGPPDWLAPLHHKLSGLSAWMKTGFDSDGTAVIHCGATDLAVWARHAGHLGGATEKVRARGNTLSFHYAGRPVRIVLQPAAA